MTLVDRPSFGNAVVPMDANGEAINEAGFRRMGVKIETNPEGFHVPGRQSFHAAEIDSAGDHRIAMAFAVAALAADGPCVIDGAESASVSFHPR